VNWEELNTYSLLLLGGGGALSAGLLLALSLLEKSLRDQDLVVGGDGTVQQKSRLVLGPQKKPIPVRVMELERRREKCKTFLAFSALADSRCI